MRQQKQYKQAKQQDATQALNPDNSWFPEQYHLCGTNKNSAFNTFTKQKVANQS